MDSARRLYLYTLCAISLTLLTVALTNLLGLLLDALYWQVNGAHVLTTSDSGAELRQQASIYASIALVTLPVWALHWWLAQRALTDADEERATLRALYRAGVLAASIIAITVAATDIAQRAIAQVAITPRFSFDTSSVPRSIAVLLAVTTVALYHARTMRPAIPDARGRIVGAAGWLQRVPTLLALSIAFGMLLSGSMRLLALLVERVGWSGDILADADIWARATADAAGIGLVGLALWIPFWLGRTRLQTAPANDSAARGERQSALWQIWLVLATATLAAIGAGLLHVALFRSLQWLFLDPLAEEGISGLTTVSALLRCLPPLAFTAYLIAWVATSRGSDAVDDADTNAGTLRAQWYGLAAVGLAMLGSGLVLLGMAVIDANDNGQLLTGSTDFPRHALLRASALAVVGLALWTLAWLRSAALQPPEATTGATRERRGYLLLVVGASLIVGLSAAAVLLYTLLQRLLDATPNDGSSISTSLITLAVAVPILLLHALAWRGLPETPEPPATTDDAKVQTRRLILELDEGLDAKAVLAQLQQTLPAGARLRDED